MHLPSKSSPENCPSCGAAFKGKFCHKCGEKRISAKDFEIKKYAQTLAEHFTHLDSKLLRSLWVLISKPGFLTAEFVAGRRNLYVKPLQLFLLLNLAFFLFFGDNDIFAPKLKYIYHSNTRIWSGETVKDLADAYAQKENLSIETAIKTIDAKSGNLTKAMLYLFVPLFGCVFFALFFRQIPFFICHLIFATHWFSFLLMLILLGGGLLFLIFKLNGLSLLLSILAMLLPFQLIATRRFYGGNWVWLFVKTLMVFALLAVFFLLYRQFVLFLTLRLI